MGSQQIPGDSRWCSATIPSLPDLEEPLYREQPLFSLRSDASAPHPPVERSQRGTVPRLHSGKFPGSSRQGIKAQEGKGAALPAPELSPPPAPAMNPHLLLLVLLAAAALCQGKRPSRGYPSVRGRASAGVRGGRGVSGDSGAEAQKAPPACQVRRWPGSCAAAACGPCPR